MSAIVLASASRTRAALLQTAGIPFEAVPAHVDEDSVKQSLLAEGVEARGVADALAELKAVRVSGSQPAKLVLGADQVLAFQGELLSKTATIAEARAQFLRLRGRCHVLISAAALAREGAVIWRHVEESRLWMRDFSDDFLDFYLGFEGEAVLRSVGGYRLEGLGVQLFARLEGDYFSILGLPLLPLLTALRQQGVLAQ